MGMIPPMPPSPPSGLDRLKELLFAPEARSLEELGRRVAESAEANDKQREVLGERIAQVFDRVGTDERLRTSVAGVIDQALREAEVARHDALADAIAPLVVRTIKTEIVNSRDELVEVLYPMTGRMVRSYVASAMKELADEVNRRIELNPFMLRIQSLATGRPVSEIVLARRKLAIEAIYLVRRGTGELLAHWPSDIASIARDQLMSGVLSAINEFASQSLNDEGGELREIDVGDRRLYLRASPTLLLAAKCAGSASPAVEAIVDEEFLRAIEAFHEAGPDTGDSVIEDLARSLTGRIQHREHTAARRGVRPLALISALVALPLVCWLGWSLYVSYRTQEVRKAAAGIIAAIDEARGYPITLDVGRLGATLGVNGLAPTGASRRNLIAKLKSGLPATVVEDRLAVLPSELQRIEPEFTALRRQIAGLDAEVKSAAVARSLGRAAGRLARVGDELARLQSTLSDGREKDIVTATAEAVKATLPGIERCRAASAEAASSCRQRLHDVAGQLKAASESLGPLIPGGAAVRAAETRAALTPAADTIGSAELVSDQSEQLDAMTLVLTSLTQFKNALPSPSQPTARDRLLAWIAENAIFFSTGSEYRDPRRAEEQLRDLADLVKKSGSLLRVIGYTDEKGQSGDNQTLSARRAARVAEDLNSLGVPTEQTSIVGRIDRRPISAFIGDNSPNRRVEFEIGFVGEAAP